MAFSTSDTQEEIERHNSPEGRLALSVRPEDQPHSRLDTQEMAAHKSRPTAFLGLLAGVAIVGVGFSALGKAAEPLPPQPGVSEPGAIPDQDSRPGKHYLDPDVCIDAGYLCTPLFVDSEMRLLRWATAQERLVVVVEFPEHEPEERARQLQRAAVRGLQAWQGKPFPMTIQDREATRSSAPDIVVRWQRQLDGTALGITRTRWEIRPGEDGTFSSVEIVLATRNPFNARFELSADDLMLVAAHEMGHALGLPHSDDTADLMFPKNTASHLTAQDYRTLQSLYALPNGSFIGASQD